MIPHFLLAGLAAGAAQPPAQEPLPPTEAPAPEADAEEDEQPRAERPLEGEEGEEIVVTGQRQRGAVDSDIPPEVQLNGREIRALGASNLSELLDALAPQTRSGRGRGDEGPVTLLNGRRISGFAEIRDIPPEAIQRVDILPEEVALQYGYRADQRVVNFVLRRRFRAVTTEIEAGAATAGGRESGEASLNVLRISRDGRWSVGAEYQKDSALLESERDIEEAVGGQRDPRVPTLSPFRTLLPATEQFTVNGTVNRSIFGNISATLNGRYEVRSSESRFGLPSLTLQVPGTSPFARTPAGESVFRLAPAAGPLERQNDNQSARLGFSLNGDLRPWRWSLTGNLDRNISENLTAAGLDPTLTQTRILAGDPAVDPFGDLPVELLIARPGDRSRSRNDTGSVELVANGPLLELPAGQVSASLRTGVNTRDLSSRSIRSGVLQERDLGRDQVNAQLNVDIPLTSRRRDVLRAVGNLSANFNAEVQQLSDFGTLRTLGAGLNWSPIEQVSFIASVTDEDGAPSIQQLGDPPLLTPNARVFDFVRGETVEVALLTGGNPDLVADNRRVLKLGATVRPLKDEDLSLTANYTDNEVRNPIAGFPTATAEIEAAFPDRFERNSEGRLLRIDTRPVNFARSTRREMRWGLNYSKPIGPQGRPGGPGGAGGPGRPGGAAGPGAGGGNRRPGAGAAPAGGAQAPATPPAGASAQGAGDRPQGGGGAGGGGFRGGGGRPGGFGGGGFRGPGGPGGFGGGGGGGRLQLGLYHNWRIEDSVLIREGVPELDFLSGSAFGGRGGRPRHEIEGQAGFFKDGFGSFLFATWQQGTTVRGGNLPGQASGDLFFSSTATVHLRLFANLGQQQSLVKKIPFLRGSRVTLAASNLFDSRPRVRDSSGTTPLSYQPNLIDPLGRTVRISFRKMFF